MIEGVNGSEREDLRAVRRLTEDGYRLDEGQAKDILEMRLQRLTGLEQDRILKEYGEVNERILELLEIIENPETLMKVIRSELCEIKEVYGESRKTAISAVKENLMLEDLIPEEDVVVTFSHAGYAKSQSMDTYKQQKRGGSGKTAATTREEDFVENLYVARSHDTLLCFSNRGKVYWLKVYQIPQGGRTARGRALVNLLPLEEGERITVVSPVKEFDPNLYVVMATANGIIKKTSLASFSRPRPSGIIAVNLTEGDRLIGAILTNGSGDLMLVSSGGKAIRFSEERV